ncbi:MAG: exosome complex protein Rrp42 [Nanoarchaeota archaeon]
MFDKHLKNYIISLLEEGKREDFRALDEYRKIKIKTNINPNSEGSAYVELGNTKVIAGVKISIGEPFPEFPEDGIVIFELDLSPTSHEDTPAELIPIEAELARVIDRGFREGKVIDTKKLCIEKGKFVYTIFIDIIVLNDDGNVIDAGALASFLALATARLPKIEKENETYKVNPKEKTKRVIPLTKIVLPITLAKINNSIIVDPTKKEEKFADLLLTISREEEFIHGLQKSKYGSINYEEIKRALELSRKKFKELKEIVKPYFKENLKMQTEKNKEK